jgi:hypothetical protein
MNSCRQPLGWQKKSGKTECGHTTEKEKMLSGEFYDTRDQQLRAMSSRAGEKRFDCACCRDMLYSRERQPWKKSLFRKGAYYGF